MRIFNDLSTLPKAENTILTLGIFDGVHLGHKKIIEKLKKKSAVLNCRNIVITFSPHPRNVISENGNIMLLTTIEEKIKLFEEIGIENLLIINFTKEFSQLSSEMFFKEYIIEKIGIKEIIVGYDHHFGKGRSGDVNTLRKMGVEFGFDVTTVEPFKINDEAVNSTKIRKALSEGNIKVANSFLGREFSFGGTVVEGDKRGRQLGFPTANIRIDNDEKLLPSLGIYAVEFLFDNEKYKGLLSIGIRPTFYNSGEIVPEVYLYDFNRDIYNKKITVKIIDWVRGEEKFPSAEALVEQMQKDKIKGLEIFKKAS
ncbi:MAG: bifunctional riboflavin kinase/FAD synthetase [Ignavibacteriaceae bacterium]|nr:bifunctional riboflavin kinase/FAD synthetase [Ignavibacteriaceae bacterium]